MDFQIDSVKEQQVHCHDCNTANSVDSKYCKECGAKMNEGYRTMMLSVQDLPTGQDEEALGRLTRLLDMAFWHNEAGNIAAAITASEAALAINPNSTTAHSLLGSLYEKNDDDAHAIEHFEAVLALNPNSAADASKLEQLRRGVHVKAVSTPITHQLVPPVLIKLGPTLRQKWAGLAEAGAQQASARRAGLQRQPLYAAGAVTGVVLLMGLLMTHPWSSASAVTTQTPVPAPLVTASRSTFGGGVASLAQISPVSPPMVLTPVPSSGGAAAYPAPIRTTRDPFAGRAPTAAPSAAPLWSLPPVPARAGAARRRQSGRNLPALRLTALLPVGSDGGLAPAPVTLLAGASTPFVSVASIPQHTVVVGSLAGVAGNQASQPDAPSHIRITIHQAKDADGDAAPIPATGAGDGGTATAASYQDSALSLQQGGQFKQARLSYQRAIRAYKAQIASGQDVETAQRGLAACQTGLQICQQSQ